MISLPLITILLSLLVVTILFLYISYKEFKIIRDISEFLPIKRFMGASEYRSTTVAAGMSLATVMIALINLSPYMGISLVITIITYVMGFILLFFAIPKIQLLNKNNETIPVFLGSHYDSKLIKKASSIFSVVGYASIFAMELIVGVTILSPFFNNYILAFAIFFFLLLLTYTLLSGFRGIVKTDIWQLKFIYLSVFGLIIFLIISYFDSNIGLSLNNYRTELLTSWNAPLAFCLGIACINIPATISDIGTWQRVCATKSTKDAQRGLKKAILIFATIWTTLILVGISYASSGITSKFGYETLPLIEGILTIISSHNTIITLIILFSIVIGLLSAMVSTADSLLIAATHTLFEGIIVKKKTDIFTLKKIRIIIAILGSISFTIFIFFHIFKLNVVQLVFAIYGAQLALFPVTFATLIVKRSLKNKTIKIGAIVSIIIGFVSAWLCAIYGHISSDINLQFYAPVVALITSALIFLIFFSISSIKKDK